MNDFSLPIAFTQRIQQQLGDEANSFFEVLNTTPPVSIRLNPNKSSGVLLNNKVDWCDYATYLNERPIFTLDPLFHAGAYYVQEASSMFIGFALQQVIDFNQTLTTIDLCAAPGGKTTQLLSLLSNDSTLFSNEIISNRNSILRENIIKWGCSNAIVTQANANEYSSSGLTADIILVDAPCSGEGMFRKDKNAITEWSKENVKNCSIRQTEIIDAISTCLKEDGILVYSTCTYNEQENDLIIEHLLNNDEFEKVDVRNLPNGIVATKYGYQFFPHKIKGEGFYCSILKYKGANKSESKASTIKSNSQFKKHLTEYLSNPNDYILYEHKGELYALPLNSWKYFHQLQKKLSIRQVGLLMGTIKGELLIPSHDLALSLDINPTIKRIELDKEKALHYLKGETIMIDSDYKGWCLATYEGLSLGWMKLVSGRMNNYYPKSSRIKMNISDYEGC
jgi:16S rRNA C967 or C1407 C5-methylase (RsmB/RsmF family)/NOL1/NOP2/fmu family ribosome biogenesis protein